MGKTSLSVNLAAELSRPDGANKRVALLDFDGQCNLTSMLGPQPPPPPQDDNEDDVQQVQYPAYEPFNAQNFREPLIVPVRWCGHSMEADPKCWP